MTAPVSTLSKRVLTILELEGLAPDTVEEDDIFSSTAHSPHGELSSSHTAHTVTLRASATDC